MALNELHSELKCNELWYWGRINGLEADYLIALEVNYENQYEFPLKKYYYASTKDFKFIALPETKEDFRLDCQKHCNDFFFGNPIKIIEKYEEEEEEGINNQNNNSVHSEHDPNNQNNPNGEKVEDDLESSIEELQVIEKKKNFTVKYIKIELARLAFVVRAIDVDTNIFPRGKYKIIPEHETQPNENFIGLSTEELTDLSKYHHFRYIKDEEKRNLVESDEAIFRFDVYESIDQNRVKGSWAIQLDPTGTIVYNKLYIE